ncbi:MAG: 6,7-dimethyl-8-ribityllumazine synthase [Bacteroidales bacterium]|nr:6,7-dimethyl-8-ribityllumazine synthase [Bacteroidales bacterium]
MVTSQKNLSSYNPDNVPSGKGMKIGIVVSEWNDGITFPLLEGAVTTLKKHGVSHEDILVEFVPGSFELTAGARMMAESEKCDGIICIGCVIRGDTPHFDYICQGVTQGITQLNVLYGLPFIFGVLTTNDLQQAKDRAGGKLGNKGDEAAITALKMIALSRKLELPL